MRELSKQSATLKIVLIVFLIVFSSINLFAQTKTMKPIHHVLIFNLKNEISETDQQRFLEGMKTLDTISGISNFEISKQINVNTKFKYVLSMDFDSEESYQAYTKDPKNGDFVKNFWLVMVDDYLVIDYEKNK